MLAMTEREFLAEYVQKYGEKEENIYIPEQIDACLVKNQLDTSLPSLQRSNSILQYQSLDRPSANTNL